MTRNTDAHKSVEIEDGQTLVASDWAVEQIENPEFITLGYAEDQLNLGIRPLKIDPSVFERHMAIFGLSGYGKSTFAETIFQQLCGSSKVPIYFGLNQTTSGLARTLSGTEKFNSSEYRVNWINPSEEEKEYVRHFLAEVIPESDTTYRPELFIAAVKSTLTDVEDFWSLLETHDTDQLSQDGDAELIECIESAEDSELYVTESSLLLTETGTPMSFGELFEYTTSVSGLTVTGGKTYAEFSELLYSFFYANRVGNDLRETEHEVVHIIDEFMPEIDIELLLSHGRGHNIGYLLLTQELSPDGDEINPILTNVGSIGTFKLSNTQLANKLLTAFDIESRNELLNLDLFECYLRILNPQFGSRTVFFNTYPPHPKLHNLN